MLIAPGKLMLESKHLFVVEQTRRSDKHEANFLETVLRLIVLQLAGVYLYFLLSLFIINLNYHFYYRITIGYSPKPFKHILENKYQK